MIESKANSKIKKIAAISTKKGRRATGEFIIEGLHMVKEAIKYSYSLIEIFVATGSKTVILPHISGAMCDIIEVKDDVFNRISNLESSQGVLAIAKIPSEDPLFAEKPFLILDRISDPGNMGTILRSAAATGFSDVVLVNCVDVFNPKTVRSSSSGLFFVKLHTMSEEQVLNLAKTHTMLAATAEGENVFSMQDKPTAFGLIIGNEANGVSNALKSASKLVALPMDERVESLNAAVSSSVLMYFFSCMR